LLLLLRGSVDAGSTHPCAGPYGRGHTPHLPCAGPYGRGQTPHQLTLTLDKLELSLSLFLHGSRLSRARTLCTCWRTPRNRRTGAATRRPAAARRPRSSQRRRATQADESNALARSSAAFPAASRASSLSPYAARCFLCSSAYARRPSDSHATCRRTQACRRRMHSLLSRAAHLCARCWLFLAHVTPTRPPLLRQYVVPRSAHGRRFSQAAQKDTRRIRSYFRYTPDTPSDGLIGTTLR